MLNTDTRLNQEKLGKAAPLIVLFLTDLTLKLIYLPFFYYRYSDTGVVLGVVDGLAYLLKSLEVAGGDFAPIRTHGIGLPLLTAPIFKLLGSQSIFVNMAYAHFINILISSLCIIPLYFIAKKVFASPKEIASSLLSVAPRNDDGRSVIASPGPLAASEAPYETADAPASCFVRGEAWREAISRQKYVYLALILFIFSFWPLYSAIGFFAEPLFTLILLIMLLFLIKAADNWRWLMAAAAFAGLGYWVKPTGILFLVITLAAVVIPPLGREIQFVITKRLLRPFGARNDTDSVIASPAARGAAISLSSRSPRSGLKQSLKQSSIVIIIFLAVSAPFLYQRFIYFGSPFYYGENSRYFVDRYDQAWGQKDSAVSFIKYFKTHQWSDYFNKFIFLGLGGLIFSLLVITLPYSIFSVWGMALAPRSPPLWPLLITIAVWLIGFIPVYQVYFTPRHLFPLIPLMAVLAVYAISVIARDCFASDEARNDGGGVIASPAPARGRDEAIPVTEGEIASPRAAGLAMTNCPSGLAMTTVAITLLFFAAGFISPQYYFINPRSHKELEFGRWAAANLRGKLAIGIGGDFVMMNLADAAIAGRGLFDIAAPRSGLELVYPGSFADYNQMKDWLQKNSIHYLALVQDNSRQRIIVPPLIYDGEIPPEDFKKIHSAADRKINWRIDIFKM